jgi:hypothetical protein
MATTVLAGDPPGEALGDGAGGALSGFAGAGTVGCGGGVAASWFTVGAGAGVGVGVVGTKPIPEAVLGAWVGGGDVLTGCAIAGAADAIGGAGRFGAGRSGADAIGGAGRVAAGRSDGVGVAGTGVGVARGLSDFSAANCLVTT